MNRINIKASQDIIDACKDFNVSKLIYTRTRCTVASTTLDFLFVHGKATRDFGYEPIVPLDKSIPAKSETLN